MNNEHLDLRDHTAEINQSNLHFDSIMHVVDYYADRSRYFNYVPESNLEFVRVLEEIAKEVLKARKAYT